MTQRFTYHLFPFFLLLACLHKTTAQTESPDTLHTADLQPVTVTAYRLEQSDLQTPLALTTVGSFRLQHGQQQLALDEALAAVPGVFVQNGGNFAQDVKVSIRGFGARSPFGIRGIKILVDGFPETSPDGQGQVDNIEPGTVTSVSVIRGASSGLYGNASGGYLSFNTLPFDEREFIEATVSAGSFGFQKYKLGIGGGKPGKVFYHLSAAHTRTDGFREQSGMKNYLLNGGVMVPLDSSARLLVAFNYVNSPLALDPGGLTLEQAEERPRSAFDRNVQFDASEELEQGRLGVIFIKKLSPKNRLTAKAYHTRRTFSNKLPFVSGGIVELERKFTGGGLSYHHRGNAFHLPWQLSLGLDVEIQNDDRSRFDNLDGIRGTRTFDQREKFTSLGIYLVQSFMVTRRLSLHPGIRYDVVGLEARDRFLADGNDSGDRTLGSINPIAGAVYSLSASANFYANVATSFETPTLSELSANPSGGGGFNRELEPQKAVNFEIGMKGFLENIRLRYDVALFHIRLRDEFIQYELPAFPQRTFFRNAAKSERTGIEAGIGSYLGKGFYAYLNYTFSDFSFTEYRTAVTDFNGKQLPGIPRHLAYFELRYFKSEGFYGVLQTQYIGAQYADDANEVETKSYFLANIRAGYTMKFRKWLAEPFLGVNNLFDTFYFSNLRINAAAARYYEPGAGRHYFGGLRVRFG